MMPSIELNNFNFFLINLVDIVIDCGQVYFFLFIEEPENEAEKNCICLSTVNMCKHDVKHTSRMIENV